MLENNIRLPEVSSVLGDGFARMGFRKLVEKYRSTLTETASNNPVANVALRVVALPGVLDIVSNFYHSLPTFAKMYVKSNLIDTVKQMLQRHVDADCTKRTVSKRASRYVQHVVEQLRTQTTSPDLEVRRWAQACNDLYKDKELLSVLLFVMDGMIENNDLLEPLLITTLDWTMSECCARNTIVDAFEAK